MADTCSIILETPQGEVIEQFEKLKQMFGYPIAYEIFTRVIHKDFKNKFRNIKFDKNGIPTLESILGNKAIKDYIGRQKMVEGLEKSFKHADNNIENYENLITQAYSFNTEHPLNKNFVTIVEEKENGKIGLTFYDANSESKAKASEQFATMQLNKKLVELFTPLGLTIGILEQSEDNVGRVGKIDFKKAKQLGQDFVHMIEIANNMKGSKALSEEFSHLLIRMFANDPLIQRSLNVLTINQEAVRQVLGETYETQKKKHEATNKTEDEVNTIMAEEALGHILQDGLIGQMQEKLQSKSLFQRTIEKIKGFFRRFVNNSGKSETQIIDNIQSIIDDAETSMSTVARNILEGTKQITRQSIEDTETDLILNSLEERIDRNLKILENAKKTEIKRYKIFKNSDKSKQKALIAELSSFSRRDADTVEGIIRYAKSAFSILKSLKTQFDMFSTMDSKDKFKFLRMVKGFLDSYGGFIVDMNNAINKEESEEDNIFLRTIEIDGNEVDVEQVIKDLEHLSSRLANQYAEAALGSFVEFMKPFLGEGIVVPFGKDKGKKISLEELVATAQSDITFVDRWLMSMANSKDALLAGFADVVNSKKAEAKTKFLKFRNKINLFREKCEKAGIRDFEWVFEKDDKGNKTGNYIGVLNYGQFDKDYNSFLQQLDEKYGKNPTGELATKKIEEKNNWLMAHSATKYGEPRPNSTYKNPAYAALTQTQRDLLDEFLNLKTEMDDLYPDNRVSRLKAIQKRKSGSERFWESTTSPQTLFENVKGAVAESIKDMEDNDQIFGDTTTKGMVDFSGHEFMLLPVLYTSRLKNPNELSTDLVGSLYAYSYAALEYKQMDDIVDALEVGKDIVSNQRKVIETRGNNPVMEKINAIGESSTNVVVKTASELEKKLADFIEAQVYQRHLKDAGTFGDSKINKQKSVSLLLRMSSLSQMGFNFLAQTANVANGIAMQNIEAVAGQFFKHKQLVKADGIYATELPKIISEFNSRTKTSKLGLFSELFDVKQDFKGKTSRLQTKNWLKRLFGESVAYIGQEAGDHWLYHRTALAMALKEKVLYKGKEMSLWDALQVKSVPGSTNLKELNIDEITDLNGNPFDVYKFSAKVKEVNQRCFGIYNEEDLAAVHRTILGRLALQYRKWMVPLYSNRFQSARYNKATDTYNEGFYVTLGRFLVELKRGQFQIAAQWHKLSDEEKFNVKRAITEIIQVLALWALVRFIEWPDDKNRPWALKMAEYIAKRELHELGGLAPSPIMVRELTKTIQQPVPSLTAAKNLFEMTISLADPTDYMDEIQSGPYKGLSTVEKNILKAPIPGISQYRQVNKFVKEIDDSINFYARPY